MIAKTGILIAKKARNQREKWPISGAF